MLCVVVHRHSHAGWMPSSTIRLLHETVKVQLGGLPCSPGLRHCAR